MVQEAIFFQKDVFFMQDNAPYHLANQTNECLNKVDFKDFHLKLLTCLPNHNQTGNS